MTTSLQPAGYRGVRIKRPAAWPFALPAMVALVIVLLVPLGYNLWISVHVDRISAADGTFVGLENYIRVIQNGTLAATLGRTMQFTVGSILLQSVLGFSCALALEKFPRASQLIRPVLLVPWVIPGVAVAAIWMAIFNPLTGLANRILTMVGMAPIEWLGNPAYAMWCLILVNTWKSAPYWILMLSAGLTSVPKETREAATIDGARYLQVLWHVILPGLRPVLITTTLLAFIWTFNYYDLAYLLTKGGPDGATTTLSFAIWESALKYNRFDEGAAISVLSIALTGIAIVAYFVTLKRKETS